MRKLTFSRLILVPALVIGASVSHAQGVITTISGNGIAGFSGDGGAAISAQYNNPSGVTVNSAGDIFIADKSNSRVRKISGTTGTVSTFCGTGIFGLSGLGGPAVAMNIRMPDAVYVTPTGSVMISDWYNDMVFYIDGITFEDDDDDDCGDGNQGDEDDCPSYLGRLKTPSGACMDMLGRKYIADNGNNRVRMVVPVATASGVVNMIHTLANETGAYGYSGDGDLARFAHFSHIGGIYFDNTTNTDLYIADQGNNVIRKINMSTGIITTVVGTGVAGYSGDGGAAASAQLSNPGTLFVDASRNLYICDRGNNAIRKVNLVTGVITTIAGNGTLGFSGDGGISTAAQLNDPQGVCVDNTGRVFIADMGNQRIRMITPIVTTTTSTTPLTGTFTGTTSTIVTPAPVFDPHVTGSTAHAGHFAGKITPSVASYAGETRIFPNPSTGVFTLQSATELTGAALEVYNVLGQKILSTSVNGQQAEINLSSQPAGLYTMNLHTATGIFTQKLTITH